jgi:4-amino-4-deoxy-L-arabinose transferase-like glycosyltransferase
MDTTLRDPSRTVARSSRLRVATLVRGRQSDEAWVRPALLTLLGVTALLYLWSLGASGWANSFYSAAVQAGSTSWKAFFFGSFDSSNFITVDKPPAALWVMDISARLFGLNSWSILVPEALAGVATVGLVFATVRRWFTPAAGLLAGAVVALTPVAALMFRFNNPDALLVLLLAAATYATVRAIEDGGIRWLALAGMLIGTGFLTKMLQAFLVLPALALVFLVAAPTSVRRRLLGLLAAGVALVVSSGWWVAIVQLIPAADRPYIGGSQDNSLINLILGYNGLGRLTGNEAGSIGGTGTAGSMWGPTGWNRLFLANFGGQIAWLIPAALILLVAGLWVTRRAPRTDRTRAAFLLWGGVLLVTCAVISFSSGIIHPYYTVALAPPVGAIVGMGVVTLWRRRERLAWRLVLAATLAATVVCSYVLLGRSAGWYPWLRTAVIVLGLAAAAGLALTSHRRGRLSAALAVVGLLTGLAGTTAYTVDTVLTPHTGAIVSAGPAVAGGGFGGPGGAGRPGGRGGAAAGRAGFGGGPGGFAPPGGPGGGVGAFGGRPPGGFGGGPGGAGPGSGLLNSSPPGSALVALLSTDAGRYTWVAATMRANSAAGYQLATGTPVMAIGGFNGTDPTPTLAQFEAAVQQHQIHYFITGGRGGGPRGGGSASTSAAITTWVQSTFTARTVDGVTVYDLTVPASS